MRAWLFSLLSILLAVLISGCAARVRAQQIAYVAQMRPTPTSIVLSARIEEAEIPATGQPFMAGAAGVTAGALQVLELPVVPAAADLRDCRQLSAAWAGVRAQTGRDERPQPMTLEAVNRAINPSGYLLEPGPPAMLQNYGQPLRAVDVLPLAGVELSSSSSGAMFAWYIRDTTESGWLVQTGRVLRDYRPAEHFNILPQFVGEDVISLYSAQMQSAVQVLRDDRLIYEHPYNPDAACTVRGLRAAGQSWVLNLANEVIIDGVPLSLSAGYAQVFDWSLLNGKPLYFYQDGERAGVVYDGSPLPLDYEAILRPCSQPADEAQGCDQPTLIARPDLVAFFAQRQGQWYYVELRP